MATETVLGLAEKWSHIEESVPANTEAPGKESSSRFHRQEIHRGHFLTILIRGLPRSAARASLSARAHSWRADMLKMHEDAMDKFGVVLWEIRENRLAIRETRHHVDRLEPHGNRCAARHGNTEPHAWYTGSKGKGGKYPIQISNHPPWPKQPGPYFPPGTSVYKPPNK